MEKRKIHPRIRDCDTFGELKCRYVYLVLRDNLTGDDYYNLDYFFMFLQTQSIPSFSPVPSTAVQALISQVRPCSCTKLIFSATSAALMASGISCLLAKISTGTCFNRLSMSISNSSLPASGRRVRSVQSIT